MSSSNKGYIKIIKEANEYTANIENLSKMIFKILDIDIDEAIVPFYDKDGDWDFDTYDKEYILEQIENFIKNNNYYESDYSRAKQHVIDLANKSMED